MLEILFSFPIPDRMNGETILPEEISHWECRMKLQGTPDSSAYAYQCPYPTPFTAYDIDMCWAQRPIMLDGINGDFSKWLCVYSEP